MKRTGIVLCVLLVMALQVTDAAAKKKFYPHQEYFEHYEGTQTCLECHEEEATSFFHSQHYQWQGEAPDIIDVDDDQKLGKMNTMNDFCTNPAANWIGDVQNPDGKSVAKGCSKCHAGLGLMPTAEISRAQLENIDCLICHASGYRRDLYRDDEAAPWRWRPILWKNQRGLDSVAKRIGPPTRAMCLRCHSGAGGGPNFKRGDIEYALQDCSPDFDVHMASEGNNLSCADCHGGQDHRVRGRGADLSGTDNPGNPLSCESCHDAQPHGIAVLDHHARKVDCTVCHIPEFAKDDATDMARDWSTPYYHADANKYSATITMQKNVRPVYAWFNGKTHLMRMGQEIEMRDDGTVGIMVPDGRRKDKHAKLHAFKLHRGVLPVLKDKRWLIPIAVEEFFADGDIDKAVAEGAAAAYGIHHPQYDWVPTVRYMGIFHEVQPAANALDCLDCHSPQGRLDWQALGYDEDPIENALD